MRTYFLHIAKRVSILRKKENKLTHGLSLCEKCPNTEFFLVHIFPYSDRTQENTTQKKLRIWTLFTQCVGRLQVRPD